MPPRIAFGGLKVAWKEILKFIIIRIDGVKLKAHDIMKACNTLNKRKVDLT
jgi:hypothetical protein